MKARAAAVFAALKARRSIRRFKPKAVPRAALNRLVEAACLAPSSLDGKPWRFVVLTDRGSLRALAEIKRRHMPRAKSAYPCAFLADAPCVLVVCVDRRAAHGREAEDAALAAANVLVLAPQLGLGSVYLTAHRDGDAALEREVAALLKLPASISPRVILPLGYPEGKTRPRSSPESARRLHAERWNG